VAAPVALSKDRPIVVAIGGNSLLKSHQVGHIEEQRQNAAETCEVLADVLAAGHRLILTHGNGPQVGNVLLRVDLAAEHVYRLPLDICDSDTQGGIGYMLQQILGDKLEARGTPRRVATIITQVLVDGDDPAFQRPTKPIGAFLTREEAAKKRDTLAWDVREIDSRGWRRVVPSPQPKDVIELDAIRAVYAANITPICVGGGGVPVRRSADGCLVGVEAVIDKDLATSLLARKLGAELLVITTGVPQVLLDYEKPTQRPLGRMTLPEARHYLAEGQFAPGSMGPKIQAAIDFLDAGGGHVLITDPESLREALRGEGGTWISA
jgi:carbamate kinase